MKKKQMAMVALLGSLAAFNAQAATDIVWDWSDPAFGSGTFVTATQETTYDGDTGYLISYATGVIGGVNISSTYSAGIYNPHTGVDTDDLVVPTGGQSGELTDGGMELYMQGEGPGYFLYASSFANASSAATGTMTITATSPVPEPTTLALVGLGGAALLLRKRK